MGSPAPTTPPARPHQHLYWSPTQYLWPAPRVHTYPWRVSARSISNNPDIHAGSNERIPNSPPHCPSSQCRCAGQQQQQQPTRSTQPYPIVARTRRVFGGPAHHPRSLPRWAEQTRPMSFDSFTPAVCCADLYGLTDGSRGSGLPAKHDDYHTHCIKNSTSRQSQPSPKPVRKNYLEAS